MTTKQLLDRDGEFTAAAAGILGEALRARTLGLEGRVEVDIIDDRTGRIVDHIEADNYVVTDQWQAFASALQRLAWTYGYQGDSSTVTVRATDGRDPRHLPSFRNDLIACWSDSTAIATGDVYAMGEIIAWAHRWQQGSPSTRQGIVQPGLCTLTDTAVSWVWEWATSNGNGTFSSVGWRRLGYTSNTGNTAVYDLPCFSRRSVQPSFTDGVSVNASSAVTPTAGATFSALLACYYDAGSGKLYQNTSISSSAKLISVAVTIDAAGNFTHGNVVDESAAAFAAGLGGDSVLMSTRSIQGITRLGPIGDWIGVGSTGVTTSRRPTIRRVTNAGSLTYTNANAGTYSVESTFIDVTYDGTNLYVVALNGNTGAPGIHRIDPATGTISATLTLAGLPAYAPSFTGTARGWSGIEWDADNGWLWLCTGDGYLLNIDTSGNWQGVLMYDTGNSYPISAATLTGQHNTNRANTLGTLDVDPAFVLFAPSAGAAVDSQTNPGAQSERQAAATNITGNPLSRLRLMTMDGDVWAGPSVGTYITSGRFGYLAFTEKRTYASRTLLGSPTTKTNTQTMRIRYTMTFT